MLCARGQPSQHCSWLPIPIHESTTRREEGRRPLHTQFGMLKFRDVSPKRNLDGARSRGRAVKCATQTNPWAAHSRPTGVGVRARALEPEWRRAWTRVPDRTARLTTLEGPVGLALHKRNSISNDPNGLGVLKTDTFQTTESVLYLPFTKRKKDNPKP